MKSVPDLMTDPSVVDLDARLRNERRVEQELLELLDSRDESPLEEILKLRGEIAKVRTQIERYTAQQDRLSRLVSLATVLIIIRPENIEQIEVPDEARISAMLNHPNVVQIYDLGKEGETYFIAMEYIAGENLATIRWRSRKKSRPRQF